MFVATGGAVVVGGGGCCSGAAESRCSGGRARTAPPRPLPVLGVDPVIPPPARAHGGWGAGAICVCVSFFVCLIRREKGIEKEWG